MPVHKAQGFVPAILAREILLRTSPLRRGGWLRFIIVSICLAISASYELIEWVYAAVGGEGSEDFLGMQGDVWDAQKDMLLALIGAITALLTFSRVHDRSMSSVTTAWASCRVVASFSSVPDLANGVRNPSTIATRRPFTTPGRSADMIFLRF